MCVLELKHNRGPTTFITRISCEPEVLFVILSYVVIYELLKAIKIITQSVSGLDVWVEEGSR